MLFWPKAPAGNPYWPDATQAAETLIVACIRRLEDWGVSSQGAEGELSVPGVCGVPEQWPYIRVLYERAGFAHTGHTEGVYLATVEDLPHPAEPPITGLSVRRSVGMSGTRLSVVRGEEVLGYIEVEVLEQGNGCPATAGGPISGTCMSPANIAATGSPPDCSGRRLTGCGWRRPSGCSPTRG